MSAEAAAAAPVEVAPAAAAAPPAPAPAPTAGDAVENVDFEPPAACINRIVKAALPENVQVTKEAKQAFSKAAGIFIIYLTTCANEFCRDKKRQTVSAADVRCFASRLAAVSELDLEDGIPDFKAALQSFLASFRSNESGKRKTKDDESAAAKKRAKQTAEDTATTQAAPAEDGEDGADEEDGDEEEAGDEALDEVMEEAEAALNGHDAAAADDL